MSNNDNYAVILDDNTLDFILEVLMKEESDAYALMRQNITGITEKGIRHYARRLSYTVAEIELALREAGVPWAIK